MAFTINLTRVVDGPLELKRDGDKLIFNGEEFDFGTIPDGATVPIDAHDCRWIAGDIVREGSRFTLTVNAPYAGGSLPEHLWNPPPIVSPGHGTIRLPAYEVEVPDAVQD